MIKEKKNVFVRNRIKLKQIKLLTYKLNVNELRK